MELNCIYNTDYFSRSSTFSLVNSILNRNYIAFEKDTEIFNKSLKRLKEYEIL